MQKLGSLGFFLLLLFKCSIGFGQTDAPVPASTIPDFTFYTLDGNKPFTQDQLSLKGRTVFIFFDPDCHYCQDELSDIGDHLTAFKQVEFYLIAMQDKPIILDFMDKYGNKLKDKSNVTVLHDANTEFIPKFEPSKYPAMFIYGPDKHLIKYFDGPKPIKTILKAINE